LDTVTHGLMALALARGFFSRRGWAVAVGMMLAGTLADIDLVSALFGPRAYLDWHGTYTHSLIGTLVIVAIATIIARRLDPKKTQTFFGIAAALVVAAIAHLLLDWCHSEGVTLLWPLRSTRFAADLLPGVDAWILALLIFGLVTPELFRLVSSEIGAKDKAPRGRTGAILAIALMLLYVGARFVLHGSAVAEMDAHSYRGESPRRVGAFADSLSIFTWHGIVETQSLVCLVEAPAGTGAPFNAEAAACQHKPESSPELDLAQQTVAARKFLSVARFPKASVEKIEDGFEVSIRGLEDAAQQAGWGQVAAQITLNAQPKVIKDEVVWSKDLGRH
jgi:inner membrane protein